MLQSFFKKVFAVLAIVSASCGFVLFALPTPKAGALCVTLSLFFSFLWLVASLGDDINEVEQWEKQQTNNN